MKPEIRIASNADELARAAAAEFINRAAEAVLANGLFSVALSGGSTPKSLYSLLANDASLRAQVPWELIHFFWGDERHVPPDHPDSNYRMTCEAMLSKVAVPAANIHRIKGEYADPHQPPMSTRKTCESFLRLRANCLDLISCCWGWGRTDTLLHSFPAQTRLANASNSFRKLG